MADSPASSLPATPRSVSAAVSRPAGLPLGDFRINLISLELEVFQPAAADAPATWAPASLAAPDAQAVATDYASLLDADGWLASDLARPFLRGRAAVAMRSALLFLALHGGFSADTLAVGPPSSLESFLPHGLPPPVALAAQAFLAFFGHRDVPPVDPRPAPSPEPSERPSANLFQEFARAQMLMGEAAASQAATLAADRADREARRPRLIRIRHEFAKLLFASIFADAGAGKLLDAILPDDAECDRFQRRFLADLKRDKDARWSFRFEDINKASWQIRLHAAGEGERTFQRARMRLAEAASRRAAATSREDQWALDHADDAGEVEAQLEEAKRLVSRTLPFSGFRDWMQRQLRYYAALYVVGFFDTRHLLPYSVASYLVSIWFLHERFDLPFAVRYDEDFRTDLARDDRTGSADLNAAFAAPVDEARVTRLTSEVTQEALVVFKRKPSDAPAADSRKLKGEPSPAAAALPASKRKKGAAEASAAQPAQPSAAGTCHLGCTSDACQKTHPKGFIMIQQLRQANIKLRAGASPSPKAKSGKGRGKGSRPPPWEPSDPSWTAPLAVTASAPDPPTADRADASDGGGPGGSAADKGVVAGPPPGPSSPYPCRDFAAGHCLRGERCRFVHPSG